MSEYPIKTYKALTGVPPKAQPFFITSCPDNDQVVIIIHGVSSTPYSLHFIADILATSGYDVDTILLAGHGTTLADLRRSTFHDWVESADTAVQANLARYKKVYILGYSFGASLAIHLGVCYPQIKGIISLGIPITLYKENTIRALLPLARFFLRNYKKHWITAEKAKLLPELGQHTHIPVPTLVQFRRFISHCTKRDIPHLRVPILIGHSRADRVADPVSSQYLFQNLKVKDKSLYLIDHGNHRVDEVVSRDFVSHKILRFLQKH